LPVAAEAARKRYDTSPAHVACAADVPVAASGSVPSLRELLIKYVSSHVCSGHNPITGMQGLPAHIASGIVDYLLQERLLRPKILHAFVSWSADLTFHFILFYVVYRLPATGS